MPALPPPKTLGEVDDAEKQFSAPLFPFFILLFLPPGRLEHRDEGCHRLRCLVNRGMMGVNSLPKTVTRQRRDCDLNPGLLCLSPAR